MSKLYFIQHSCYLWEGEKAFLLWDYYGEGEPEMVLSEKPEKPLYILASHSHHDHYTPRVFNGWGMGREVTYLFHRELWEHTPPVYRGEVHYMECGESYHDDYLSVRTFGSTDEGGSFLCYAEGLRMFHAGDLNNWHWNQEALEAYVVQYEAAWQMELEKVTKEVSQLDLLMFPTDLRLGRDYLKGLRELLERVSVRYLAPMHVNGVLNPYELQQLATQYHIELLLPQPLIAYVLL